MTGAAEIEGSRQIVPRVGQSCPQQSTDITSVINSIVTATEAVAESEQEYGTPQHHQRDAALQPTHQDTQPLTKGGLESRNSICKSWWA